MMMEDEEELVDKVENEDADTFNDETFGEDDWQGGNNLPDFFRTSDTATFETLEGNGFEDRPGELPPFFADQEDEFPEEPLEPPGETTTDENNYFGGIDDSQYFFSAQETEENEALDFQMKDLENVFKFSILDDQENELPQPVSTTSPAQGAWSSPNKNIWGASSSQSPRARVPLGGDQLDSANDEIVPRSRIQQGKADNPLMKFFPVPGGQQVIGSAPVQPIPGKKALSVEELEAQLRKQSNRPAPQEPAHPPPNQGVPIQNAPMSPNRQQQYQQYQQYQQRGTWSTNNKHQDYKSNQFHRPRWTESKQRMTAAEIEWIIRMQETQLQVGDPFAEDYYFHTLEARKKGTPVVSHKPIFESYPIPQKFNTSNRKDPFEGALGRIPSHSVRAPRPLLQLEDNAEGLSSRISSIYKTTYNLLISIENAYNELLDTEDIDTILKRPESDSHFNVSQLKQKREALTNELFKALQIYIPPPDSSQVRKADGQAFLFQQDETFVNFMLVQKGKKLLVRALPLLFQNHVFAIFFVFMRNLSAIVTSSRLQVDVDNTNKIFFYLHTIINDCSLQHTIITLQVILMAHTPVEFVQILQSKYGLTLVQGLLKRAHDLSLSAFSREQQHMLRQDIMQQIGQAGVHWKALISMLYQFLNGRFNLLFMGENVSNFKVWEFLAVLTINLNQPTKEHMISQLREIIKATPMNKPLQAFLQLAGEIPVSFST